MKNFIQEGTTVTVELTEAVKSGSLVVVEGVAGVAVTGGEPGDRITLNTQGVYGLEKGAAVAFAQGQRVYRDNSKNLTTDALQADNTPNTFIGHAWETSAVSESTVNVKINF